jgi:Uma2 family endonuclease
MDDAQPGLSDVVGFASRQNAAQGEHVIAARQLRSRREERERRAVAIDSRRCVVLIEDFHSVCPPQAQLIGPVIGHVDNELEPDLLVVPPRFAPGTPWAEISEHWLVVEIVSRSSRVYDREFKRDAYFALGVSELWLVDRWEKTVEICKRPGSGTLARDER